MTHYLLDTHIAMWFFNGDSTLSEKAKRIILDCTVYAELAVFKGSSLGDPFCHPDTGILIIEIR